MADEGHLPPVGRTNTLPTAELPMSDASPRGAPADDAGPGDVGPSDQPETRESDSLGSEKADKFPQMDLPGSLAPLKEEVTPREGRESDSAAVSDAELHQLMKKNSASGDQLKLHRKDSTSQLASQLEAVAKKHHANRNFHKKGSVGNISEDSAESTGQAGRMLRKNSSLAKFRAAATKIGAGAVKQRSQMLLSQASSQLLMGRLGDAVRDVGRADAGSRASRNQSRMSNVSDEEENPAEKGQKKALFGRGTAEDAEKNAFTLVMMIATLFALFGTDLYEWAGPPPRDVDDILYTIVTAVFFLFMVEFFFYTLFKPGYVNSFFFYLDFIAAASLMPDVLLLFNVELFSGAGGLTVARAGRAARAGTRAARVVRIFKLFSLIRRGKNQKKKKKSALSNDGAQPSKVGEKLSAGITQKVIIIVAVMLVFTQILELIGTAPAYNATEATPKTDLTNLEFLLDTYGNPDQEPLRSAIIRLIQQYDGTTSKNDCPAAEDYWTKGKSDVVKNCVMRFIKIKGIVVWGDESDSYNDLRTTPSERITIGGENDDSSLVISGLDIARSQALVNIVQVLFVTILLGIATALFNRDSDKLVIAPLETMAMLVRHLSQDPLANIQVDDEVIQLDSETKMIASALMKLSMMLQVAFGEAGASIIGNNMKSEGADINAVIPGQRINAIFGFCDIRNFTDCTECLQEDVMVFVNRIADYVHKATKDNEGAPNKNIGDAFLLAWRMPENKSGGKFTVADSALKAFVRTIIETNACPELREMTNRPAVQARIPGYSVRMGFGLHVGWAIEGAIGSTLKIDASYLSPNVNMASRLEAATKQYGIEILLSDAFFELLSPEVQSLCRHLDRVTVKGSKVPMDLYTYDVNNRPSLRAIKSGKTFWEQFAPLTTTEYRKVFNRACKEFLDGHWEDAHEMLTQCKKHMPEDKPCDVILNHIAEFGPSAPPSWKGYRELTEK